MVSPVDTILSTFEYPQINSLEVVPAHKYLTSRSNYLNICSEPVHSNLGNETVGYLVLTSPHAVFSITCVVPFVPPINPGPTVTITNPPPMAAVIGMLTHTYEEYLRMFNE